MTTNTADGFSITLGCESMLPLLGFFDVIDFFHSADGKMTIKTHAEITAFEIIAIIKLNGARLSKKRFNAQ